MTVNSPDEWLKLPEVGCPVVSNKNHKGSTYTVHKVGILAVRPEECRNVDTRGVWFEAGRYFFPTIDVEFGKERQLCRLPLQLSNWAIDTVALAQGRNLRFPLGVEFGVLDGRHYAEML